MGTRFGITVEGLPPAESRRISESVLREVERIDGVLSTWDPDSDLSHANGSLPGISTTLSGELADLLAETMAWTEKTGGAFDPTVGALVDAWDLRGDGRIPETEQIARALEASGPSSIELGGNDTLLRHAPNAWIDAGGFGKGAALRAAGRILHEYLAGPAGPIKARILLDLGGQIWAWSPIDAPWPVQVADPRARQGGLLSLSIRNASVATSGTSERWVTVDGARFGHILDPRTGFPAPPWGSVTVVTRDPLEADVLATALYVMGPEEALAWAGSRSEVGVLILAIEPDGIRARWNPAMETWLSHVPVPNGEIITQEISLTTPTQRDGVR